MKTLSILDKFTIFVCCLEDPSLISLICEAKHNATSYSGFLFSFPPLSSVLFLKVSCMPFQRKVGHLQLQAVKLLQSNFQEN